MIGTIKYALYGVKLNAHNFILSHEYTQRERRLRHLSPASLMTQMGEMQQHQVMTSIIDELKKRLIDV